MYDLIIVWYILSVLLSLSVTIVIIIIITIFSSVHPVPVRSFPSFRTQHLENLSVDSVKNGFLSNPAPGENIISGNLVMETGCTKTLDSRGFDSKQNHNIKGWNSHVHRTIPGKFQSSNLSRDNLSRPLRVTRPICEGRIRNWARELSYGSWGTPRTFHVVIRQMNKHIITPNEPLKNHCVLLNQRKSGLWHLFPPLKEARGFGPSRSLSRRGDPPTDTGVPESLKPGASTPCALTTAKCGGTPNPRRKPSVPFLAACLLIGTFQGISRNSCCA